MFSYFHPVSIETKDLVSDTQKSYESATYLNRYQEEGAAQAIDNVYEKIHFTRTRLSELLAQINDDMEMPPIDKEIYGEYIQEGLDRVNRMQIKINQAVSNKIQRLSLETLSEARQDPESR